MLIRQLEIKTQFAYDTQFAYRICNNILKAIVSVKFSWT